ncbi:branched-chain amino acid ABC transporter ATP-binding protein/permease [Pseudacidovorax sp. NFM-22]|uniref:branched-chain amino acid ABC transporter ATP-binding protein/permease n=1 Tax=Pseudacidovorax sp. NFM-22 TaxID=2744469 RepID=UPI001F474E8D|nr:branched-chain amino acid ABC transporter ATP-binding protein/permease [Pseudacidovorax sp. NFM-22]
MAALPLLPVPEFWITQAVYIGLYALVALGLVLITGIVGLTSFGQAAFVGVGAYTTAWLTVSHGLSPWLTLPLALSATAVIAAMLGWLTLRMSGHYLPLATMAWALSLYYLLGNLDTFGKYDGIVDVPALTLPGGLTLDSGRSFYALVWPLLIVASLAVRRLLDSRAGRALRSVKGGTTLAEAMGVDTFRAKVHAFVLAALLAALSGWLFAHFQRTVNPSPFALNKGIEYLFMAVLGGAGHVWGAVAGAALVKLLEDQLRELLPSLLGSSGNFEIIGFGIILILTLQYMRDGVWEFVDRKLPRLPRRVDWRDAAPLPRRAQPPRGQTVLAAKGLRKVFGGLVAVKDVELHVDAGEIVGLIGPNGAGKSTTFNLLTGVLPASAGEVSFVGAPVEGLNSRQIALRGMARTFQHVKMMPTMSVLENVALGAHARGHAGMWRAMMRIDRAEERQLMKTAQDQLERIGMGGLMHVPAGSLALGQQRLMEIARALAADPVLLLLDEPAAGLRHREKAQLADVLRQLRDEGLSILLVEHDMDMVMNLCDRIVVMEFGTRLMDGTPAQVQADPAVRAAYLGTVHEEPA